MRRFQFAFMAALLLASSAAQAADGTWTAPLVRHYKGGQACAYDSDSGRLLVMGGEGFSLAQASDELWAFDMNGGTSWSRIPSAGPTPGSRAWAYMAYDAPRHRVLVYGGYRSATGEWLRDLWARRLDGDHPWELLNDGAGGPSARRHAALAIDSGRNQLVLFGGASADEYLNDTWTLPLAGPPVWTPLGPAGTPPSARRNALMAYDPPRNRMVVFGGTELRIQPDFTWAPVRVYDTYVLNLAGAPGWVTPANTGSLENNVSQAATALTYDETADKMRMIGFMWSGAPDVYVLQLTPSLAWSGTPLTSGPRPEPRGYQLVARDPVGHRDVLCGGINAPNYPMMDVHALSTHFGGSPTWSRITYPGEQPPRSRSKAMLLYDAPLARIVAVGGALPGGGSTGAHTLVVDPLGRWSQGRYAGPANTAYAAAHDLTRNRVITINSEGVSAFNLFAETFYTLTPTGTYTHVSGSRAVYDAPRDRVVVFDPQSGQLWGLDFTVSPMSPAWTTISALNPGPWGRTGAMVVRDPVRERLLVLGGLESQAGPIDELWALSLSGAPEWTHVPLSGPFPAERTSGVLVYDSNRDRLVLYGGKERYGGNLTGAWVLPLDGSNQWTELQLSGPAPIAREYPAGAFDPELDRIAIWGGDVGDYYPMDPNGDLHFIEFQSVLAVEPPASSAPLAFTAGPNPAIAGVAIRLARPAAANTRVAVHDLAGRVLREATLAEGAFEWRWDEAAPAGVYFVRVAAGRESATRRIVRLE